MLCTLPSVFLHTRCRPEPSVHIDGLQLGTVTPVKVALPPRRPYEALLPFVHLVGDEVVLLFAL